MVGSSPAHLPVRNSQQPVPPSDSILEIVWRQRNVVGIAIGVCLVLALFYLLIATRYYSGNARLFVQQSNTNVMGEESKPQQDPETFLFTQKEVMGSTPVIAMTLGTPGIRELRTFEGQDNLFAYLKNSLIIEVGKKDELISVQFDTPHREEATKIVSALVDSYMNYQSKQRHSASSERLAVLSTEKEKRQNELRRKQEELQAFRAKHGMISGADEKTNVSRQKLESLSKALTDAQLETIAANSAWQDVQRSILVTPEQKQAFENSRMNSAYQAPSAVDDAALRTQMLTAQATLQQLSTQYMPNHPIIKRLRGQIDQLNINYASAVYRRFETAQAREADLQKSFDTQREQAVAQNASAVEDTRLAAEITRLQGLTDDLDKTARQMELTQGGGNAPRITVVDPPTVSYKPTRPYTTRTLALALLGGAVIGCGAACVRDWYDYRLRSADEVKSSLGITVLGLIPHVGDENSPIARGQKIHIDPQSEAAEAYRSLRTAVYFGSKGEPARTILVTSPERGDGKSTMTSNLAISIAQAGRRVLLVDADLRAPMQDLIFGMNGRIGLATVLTGRETMEGAVRHTGIENLDLLPAGVAARNPSELLNSQKFIDLLDQMAEKYDHVIIDSPPMLAVTDARIVAASADATILVLRAGKSNRKLGELSVDGLMSVGAKLMGAVVNDIQRRSYRYYGSYGKYGYGDYNRAEGDMVVNSEEKDFAMRDDNGVPVSAARSRLT